MTTKITSANITQSGTSGISSVAWQAVQTTGFTAVAGRAYPCNTTSAAFTVTLPASPAAGNVITLTDYAGTWNTNNLMVARNGNNINGAAANAVLSTNRGSVQLVYVDATQGWVSYGNVSSSIITQTITVDYLVIAGGGAGGKYRSGGGGAGGYRTSVGTSGGGASAGSALTLSFGTAYTVTVGAGGAISTSYSTNGSNGNDSVFHTITSKGGGGGRSAGGGALVPGGSGGGGTYNGAAGGAGTANQGYAGGSGTSGDSGGGGGGGAGAVGGNGGATAPGTGGVGVASSITGSSVTRAGGGGGGSYNGGVASGGSGGGGAGGSGATLPVAGSPNTGGGGGGGAGEIASTDNAAAGGSGVVILKIPSVNTATFSGGVTYSLSTAVAGFNIYTITATSTTSETVTFS